MQGSSGSGYQKIGCEKKHYAEVTRSGRPPAGAEPPDDFPPQDPKVSPICQAALTPYLGSPNADATRLERRVIWPTPQQWQAGRRWYACAVLERNPGDEAASWTGSRAGVLRDGLGTLRRCLTGEPLDDATRVVPCTQPHRSEAVEGVIPLGSHADPVPSYKAMMNQREAGHRADGSLVDDCGAVPRFPFAGLGAEEREISVVPLDVPRLRSLCQPPLAKL
ncbi:septum formation family protein [Flindersiella endophytica]